VPTIAQCTFQTWAVAWSVGHSWATCMFAAVVCVAVPHCRSTQQIVEHFTSCELSNCPVCRSVRHPSSDNKQTSTSTKACFTVLHFRCLIHVVYCLLAFYLGLCTLCSLDSFPISWTLHLLHTSHTVAVRIAGRLFPQLPSL